MTRAVRAAGPSDAPAVVLLGREAILAAALRFEDVEVLEWGGAVRVRCLTAAARDEFFRAVTVDGKIVQSLYDVKLVARSLVDADGAALMTEEEIGLLAAPIIGRLFAVADRLNAVSEIAVQAEVKNSERGPTDASSSDGP